MGEQLVESTDGVAVERHQLERQARLVGERLEVLALLALQPEIKLDRALQLFESGIKLSVECEHFIKGAKKKIEILKKKADGSLELSEFVASTSQLD